MSDVVYMRLVFGNMTRLVTGQPHKIRHVLAAWCIKTYRRFFEVDMLMFRHTFHLHWRQMHMVFPIKKLDRNDTGSWDDYNC